MAVPDQSLRPLWSRSADAESRRETDAELVLELQAGLATAAQAIWDRYSGRVYRFLFRSLPGPAQGIEDLTQEVFLRIFTRVRNIKNPAALREFVMGVAVRVLKWESGAGEFAVGLDCRAAVSCPKSWSTVPIRKRARLWRAATQS